MLAQATSSFRAPLLLLRRGFAGTGWPAKGDLSELAMWQRPPADDNLGTGPGLEDPVLSSQDLPEDFADTLGPDEALQPDMEAQLAQGDAGSDPDLEEGILDLGDDPTPQLRAAAKALEAKLARKGRKHGSYEKHAHHLAAMGSVKLEPHPVEAELKQPVETQAGECPPTEELTLPGEGLRQAMAVDLPHLRQAAKHRPSCDVVGHDKMGPGGYSGGD